MGNASSHVAPLRISLGKRNAPNAEHISDEMGSGIIGNVPDSHCKKYAIYYYFITFFNTQLFLVDFALTPLVSWVTGHFFDSDVILRNKYPY